MPAKIGRNTGGAASLCAAEAAKRSRRSMADGRAYPVPFEKPGNRMSDRRKGLTMCFAKKFVAFAAVFGMLAFVSTASAAFTPPSSIAPYLPAANATTAVKILTVGNTDVYRCGMGGTITVPKGTPMATVLVLAASNCSWKNFLANTTAPGDNASSQVVQAAQLWWTSNIYLPYYYPLLNASAAVSKASAVRQR